jgi:maltose O-acetyltransferase
MDEFLDAARVGRVIIHESCHIGARTIILPGVEIGPRTIVGAGSVVSKSLPAETVCSGSPAKVICTLQEYLDKHRLRMKTAPKFSWIDYVHRVTPERNAELLNAVRTQDAYIVGGRTAELKGEGDTART